MSTFSFESIYDVVQGFIYVHTEFAIWVAIALVVLVIGYAMMQSISFRRFMVVILLLAAVAGYLIVTQVSPPPPSAEPSQTAN